MNWKAIICMLSYFWFTFAGIQDGDEFYRITALTVFWICVIIVDHLWDTDEEAICLTLSSTLSTK